MQVKTQPFKNALEIKNEGVIFDIYGTGAKRLGDLSVTKAGLVWCKTGKRKPQTADRVNVKWEDFIAWAQARPNTIQQAAPAKINAAKLPQPKAKSKPAAGSKKPAAPAAKRAAASSQPRKKAN